MARVNNTELLEAHMRWCSVWIRNPPCSWVDFVGGPIDPLPDDHTLLGQTVWLVSDETAQRIRMINSSPHYRTLLKAWAARHVEVT
jgi:hypothetical protein